MSALMLPKPVKPVSVRQPLRRGAPLKRGKRPIKTRRPVGTKRREAKAAGYVDELTWLEVVRFYEGLCAYCEERAWTEQDHIKPIAKGGEHSIQNLCPACGVCNFAKGQSTKWQPRRRHPWMDVAPSGPNAKCCEGCC